MLRLLLVQLLAGLLPACAASLPPAALAPGAAPAAATEAAEATELREEPLPLARQGTALAEVLALRQRQAPADRADADAWIGAHLSFFARAYASEATAVRALPASAPFRRAERDFARWIGETRPDRRDASFARLLFELPVDALPGLDRFSLGVEALGTPHDGSAKLAFLHYCASSDDLATRLAHALAASGSEAARQGFGDLLAGDGRGMGTLWAAAAIEPGVWSAATEAFARADVSLDGSPQCGVLRDAWARWPERRGALLFVLARHGSSSSGAGVVGVRSPCPVAPAPVAADLAQMLATYPESSPDVAYVWTEIAEPDREEALVHALAARRVSDPDGSRIALHDVAERAWRYGDEAGLASLGKALAAAGLHVGALPSEGELQRLCVDEAYAARADCVRVARGRDMPRGRRCRNGYIRRWPHRC